MTLSKQDKVAAYLRRGFNVTQRLAIYRWDLYRLAPCIARLKKVMPIETEMVYTKKSSHARYFLSR